jgi:hypothetical protein
MKKLYNIVIALFFIPIALNATEIDKFKHEKSKTIKTEIDILSNNMILRKRSGSGFDSYTIVSPKKEFVINIKKPKIKRTMKQTSLKDFNPDFSKVKSKFTPVKFSKPNKLILVEKDFVVEIPLSTKSLKQSTFNKLFSNKKGQIALLDSRDKSNIIDVLDDVTRK